MYRLSAMNREASMQKDDQMVVDDKNKKGVKVVLQSYNKETTCDETFELFNSIIRAKLEEDEHNRKANTDLYSLDEFTCM